MTEADTASKDGNRQAKEQLKIPLTKEEINQLNDGDHIKVTLSDDSPHEEMILFEGGGQR